MKAVSKMEELLVHVTSGQGGRPTGKHCIHFGTVDVETKSGRANEIVEILTQRKNDLCCLQKTRASARLIKRNNISWNNVSWKMGEQCYFCEIMQLLLLPITFSGRKNNLKCYMLICSPVWFVSWGEYILWKSIYCSCICTSGRDFGTWQWFQWICWWSLSRFWGCSWR